MELLDFFVQIGVPIALVMSIAVAVWALITSVKVGAMMAEVKAAIVKMQTEILDLQKDQHQPYPNIAAEIEQLRANDRHLEDMQTTILQSLNEVKENQKSQYKEIVARQDRMLEIFTRLHGLGGDQ